MVFAVSDVHAIQDRLSRERGTLWGRGRRGVAMIYPSPYAIGMSSLGFQTIYRQLNFMEDTYAERAFLPDGLASASGEMKSGTLLTYEHQRPAGDFSVLAFSVAYELEIVGVIKCLRLMGLAPLAAERGEGDPIVLIGGPLTFSNPSPALPYTDVLVVGEAEDVLPEIMDVLFGSGNKESRLSRLASIDGVWQRLQEASPLPGVAKANDADLPAVSAIMTPEATLSDMFLVEAERGCSRACGFCVMRRSTNGGMRYFPVDRILDTIPEDAKRVGLVGAAVSDHPRVVQLVRALVDSGREVGLSSLRADRLTPEFVSALRAGGYRTLTVASDGASERLRALLLKKIREKHLLRAARLANDVGMSTLKVYMMIGVPEESDADLNELVRFSLELAAVCTGRTKVVLGIAPLVAKRNTPLDGTAFVGIKESDRRLNKLRRALAGKVELRAASSRWAWVEYQLAQGGPDQGVAVLDAVDAGGRFSDFRRAFKKRPLLQPSVGAQVSQSAGPAASKSLDIIGQ